MIIEKCISCSENIEIYGKKTLLKDIEDGLLIECFKCGTKMVVKNGKLISIDKFKAKQIAM